MLAMKHLLNGVAMQALAEYRPKSPPEVAYRSSPKRDRIVEQATFWIPALERPL
jgi:hypothetical protein